MATLERTRDVYEELAGYPKPPLVPMPPPGDLSSLQHLGIKLGPRGLKVAQTFLQLIGFTSFQEHLPDNIENLLRKTNFRLPGLFAPVISATLALEDDQRDLSLVERAATLLLAARSLYDDVFSANLPPDEYQGQILEMGQYPNFFSTSLMVKDRRASVFKSTSFSQITVMIGGRLYLLDLSMGGAAEQENSQDRQPSFGQVVEALTALVVQAQADMQTDEEPAIGLLTAASDSTQLRSFSGLRSNEKNASNLDALRHSLLTLCLEPDDQPSSPAEAARLAHSTNLHNRWFHSSLQLVVFGNARACAICCFTAYLDGNTMMRGAAEIQKRAAAQPVSMVQDNASSDLPKVRALHWIVDQKDLRAAQQDLEPVLDRQPATFSIDGFGTEWFAAHGVPAVPAFVLALQMSTRRLTGRVPTIHQFLSMSKYRCMDLTLADVTTAEVTSFVEYVTTGEPQLAQARSLMKEAIASQEQEARRARQYLGLDMLLGLYTRSIGGIRRQVLLLLEVLIYITLRSLGLFKPGQGDIMASHPAIYPEVPVVGRPGVRLPYVKCFGLHYQILEDRSVVTLMPGVDWTVRNEEVIAELRKSLEQLATIIASPALEP